MGNLSENIKGDLVQLNGKSADHVTHALKKMSGSEDGTMVDGLMNLVDAFIEDKRDSVSSTKKIYGTGGFVAGIVLTGLIVGGVYVYDKRKKKKEMQIEADRLQQIMDDEVELANVEKANSDKQVESNEEE